MFLSLWRALRSPRKSPSSRKGRRTGARAPAYRPRFEALEGRAVPSAVSWNAAVSGSWTDPTKWSGGAVPGPGDTVTIDKTGANYTVTLNANASVAGLALSSANATLLIQGNDTAGDVALTVASGFTNAGTITLQSSGGAWASDLTVTSGTLTSPPSGTINLNIGSGGPRVLSAQLSIRGTVNVNGPATVGRPGANDVNLGHFNLTGATLTESSTTFTNGVYGTLASTGPSAFSAASFTNVGMLNVQDGTLNLTGTFTNFNAGTSTLTGGTYSLAGKLQFTNAAVTTNAAYVVLDGPSAQIVNQSGDDALANLAANAAAGIFTDRNGRDFTTAGSFSNAGYLTVGAGSTFTVPADATYGQTGTLDVSAGGTMNVVGAFTNVSGGTLSGGTYQVAGTLQFTGAVITTNAANLRLDGPSAQITDLAGTDALANLSANTGFLAVQNGRDFATSADFSNSGILYVSPTGAPSTFTVNGTYTETGGQINVLNNGTAILVGGGTSGSTVAVSGTLTVGAGSTLAVSGLYIQNSSGTLTVQSQAAVNLSGGGSISGSLGIAADATLNLTGGSFTLAGGTSFTDTGLLQLSGAAVSIPGTLSVPNLELDSGTLAGAGALTVTTALTWTGGTQGGTGSTTLAGAATLTLSGTGTRALDQRALNLAGTTTWTDGGTLSLANGAALTNQGTGVFTSQDDNDKSITGSGSFSNAGTLNKLGAGTTSVAAGVSFSTGGTVNIQGGTLNVAGTYTQTGGGATNLSGGAALTSAGGVSIQSGSTLAGAGTINAAVTNAGQLVVGSPGSPGTLTINGNYTQTGTGSLTVEIGDPGGVGFDQLVINGLATLAGTLTVSLLDPFTPNPGDGFAILTFTSSAGSFGSVHLPPGASLETNPMDLTVRF
jgi:hypothetical protein